MATRYPGSRPFSDDPLERRLFCGRETESRKVLHTILAVDLLLLYANSGIGKTSLLNAGVSEGLRREGYWPLLLRLNSPGPDPAAALRDQIAYQVKEIARKAEGVELIPGEGAGHLARLFGGLEIWRENRLLTPIVIFDQFEELFTLWKQKDRGRFIEQLADLARRRPLADGSDDEPGCPGGRPPRVKIVISLREDFLGEMEQVAARLPEVMYKRYRLTPLTREQATEAIKEPARAKLEGLETPRFFYQQAAIDEILGFLCRRFERSGVISTDEVEPFQLQLLCQHFECQALGKHEKGLKLITVRPSDTGGVEGMRRILQEFYRAVLDLFPKRLRGALRRLCERGLISGNGKRLFLQDDQIRHEYGVTKKNLDRLVDARLLRSEERRGATFYELSHDTMVEPIQAEQSERSPDALFAAAEKHRLERDFKQAVEAYKQVTELAPDYYRAYEQWGEIYLSQGQFRRAAEVFAKALGQQVDTPVVRHRLGRALAEQGDYGAAITHYREALDADPDMPQVQLDLGDALRSAGEGEAAVEAYREALSLGKRNANVYRDVALRFIESGDVEEGLRIFQRALRKNKEFGYIFEDLATALKTRRSPELARRLCRLALEVEIKNDSYYFRIGKALASLEDHEAARRAWERSLELLPGRPETCHNLGMTLAALGRHEAAIERFKETLVVDKHFTDAHYHWGLSLAELGRHDEAIERFKKTIEDDEVYGEAYVAWGRSLEGQGRAEEARAKYRQALDLDEELADAYPELAEIAAVAGD